MEFFEPTEKTAGQILILLLVPNVTTSDNSERMTNQQIKQLEKELWEAADQLRANSKLTAAEYKDPVLGLIL